MFLTPLITGAIIALAVIILAVTSYHVAPTNTTLVVTGLGRRRFVTGGSAFIIPFLQRIDKLSLGTIQSELATKELIPTQDAILIDVKAVANFQIGTTDDLREVASRNYLNAPRNAMLADVTEVLMGKMRETIGKMTLKDLMRDRDLFNATVFEVSEKDMNNLGLELVTFNVQDFSDKEGVIKAMDADQSVEIRKEAELARIGAEQTVAERNNQLELKRAALKKESDRAKAEADLVYDTEKAVRTRELRVAEQDSQIAAEERKIDLAERQAKVRERQLDAEVRKQAEADRFAAQQQSDARLYTRQREAEAIQADADAELYRRLKEAEATKTSAIAEAAAIKARGNAEGTAVKARGVGEAEGLKAQAEAYNAMNNPLVVAQEYVKALPELVRAAAEPLSKVESITMYGEGNSSKLVGDTTRTVSQISEGLSDAIGIDLKSIITGLVAGRVAGETAKDE